MSPGATFERVYTELRRMLTEGELPPGSAIEPAAIGRQIASSITPVRDALHRLTGERLVEAPNHNGFRVPFPIEAELRDLYEWNGQLVNLAARRLRSLSPDAPDLLQGSSAPARSAASLFSAIVHTLGGREQRYAIEQTNARLAPWRLRETTVLREEGDELGTLARLYNLREQASLVRSIERYHRRRMRAVPDLIAG